MMAFVAFAALYAGAPPMTTMIINSIRNYIYSTNHVHIGLNYIVLGLIGGSIGFSYSILIRLELAMPGFVLAGADQYLT